MNQPNVVVKRAKKFGPLYDLDDNVNLVVCIGGRGGAKTYEVSKFVAFSATMRKKRCCILRDEKELIRESILNEVLMRFDTANSGGALTSSYTKLDTGIRDRKTGEMLVFTKGFRASNSDKKATLKSVSDIDIAVIEEAEDITDEAKFNTFQDSIRNKGAVVVVILNTPDVGHWIVKRYFTTVPVPGEDGYFELVPKKIDGFLAIQTSFRDNEFLPANVVARYESYGDPESHLYNKHHYLTAILGYATSGRKGQVFKKVKPISLEDYMDLPYKEIYGQDFGTAAPAGLVGIKVHRNQIFVRELNYKPMTTLELGKLYCTLGLNAVDLVVADSADPKAIAKLRNGWRGDELAEEEFHRYPRLAVGFNVIASTKGRDSVTAGIDDLNQMDFYVTEDSRNLWNEIAHYVYAQDKNLNFTNEPIDDYNHLIDPTRYAASEAKKPHCLGPISI
jgi:phage terminase large subunit